MPGLVETTIDINGVIIKQFSELKLSQGIFAHHAFRLVCPAEAIEGEPDIIFNTSGSLVGSAIQIKMSPMEDNARQLFSGIVTCVEAERKNGYAGNIIISGYSPTILMDDGLHCRIWEEKTLKNIVQDVLKDFPCNILRHAITPSGQHPFSYMVQYKESAWQFINRLAAVCKEWLYYDGSKLVMGMPQGATTELTYGVQLNRFSMCMQIKPPGLVMQGYDYLTHTVFTSASQNVAIDAGLNDLGKQALAKSRQLYSRLPKQWNNHFFSNQKQLDDVVAAHSAMQSSDLIAFNGSSDMPGIQPGSFITIKTTDMFNSHAVSVGEFTVITIDHYCDGQGNYFNDFTAVPATVKVPPVKPFPDPYCETQSAIVTDNNDKNSLGRVRVQFHWMKPPEKSPWLRMTTPHAGNGKGVYIIPETGEEVLVGFEGGNPLKPFVIGALFHGEAKTGFGNPGNDIKAIQTRSGNKIIMDDRKGSVLLEDRNGNNINMDGAGKITVRAGQHMVFECGSTTIELKKDGTIRFAGEKIEIIATKDVKMRSGMASFTADGQTDEARINGNALVAVTGKLIKLN